MSFRLNNPKPAIFWQPYLARIREISTELFHLIKRKDEYSSPVLAAVITVLVILAFILTILLLRDAVGGSQPAPVRGYHGQPQHR